MSKQWLNDKDSPTQDNAVPPKESGGKLAVGVAATLGAVVFYNWLEKQLAKEDPEDYARLRRLQAGIRNGIRTKE